MGKKRNVKEISISNIPSRKRLSMSVAISAGAKDPSDLFSQGVSFPHTWGKRMAQEINHSKNGTIIAG